MCVMKDTVFHFLVADDHTLTFVGMLATDDEAPYLNASNVMVSIFLRWNFLKPVMIKQSAV